MIWDLPPVEDRIPKEPKLPNEMPSELLEFEIGKYGGTLNTVSQSINWDPDLFVMSNEPLINTPGILGEEVTNVPKTMKYQMTKRSLLFI